MMQYNRPQRVNHQVGQLNTNFNDSLRAIENIRQGNADALAGFGKAVDHNTTRRFRTAVDQASTQAGRPLTGQELQALRAGFGDLTAKGATNYQTGLTQAQQAVQNKLADDRFAHTQLTDERAYNQRAAQNAITNKRANTAAARQIRLDEAAKLKREQDLYTFNEAKKENERLKKIRDDAKVVEEAVVSGNLVPTVVDKSKGTAVPGTPSEIAASKAAYGEAAQTALDDNLRTVEPSPEDTAALVDLNKQLQATKTRLAQPKVFTTPKEVADEEVVKKAELVALRDSFDGKGKGITGPEYEKRLKEHNKWYRDSMADVRMPSYDRGIFEAIGDDYREHKGDFKDDANSVRDTSTVLSMAPTWLENAVISASSVIPAAISGTGNWFSKSDTVDQQKASEAQARKNAKLKTQAGRAEAVKEQKAINTKIAKYTEKFAKARGTRKLKILEDTFTEFTSGMVKPLSDEEMAKQTIIVETAKADALGLTPAQTKEYLKTQVIPKVNAIKGNTAATKAHLTKMANMKDELVMKSSINSSAKEREMAIQHELDLAKEDNKVKLQEKAKLPAHSGGTTKLAYTQALKDQNDANLSSSQRSRAAYTVRSYEQGLRGR